MEIYEFKKTVLPHTLRWEGIYSNRRSDKGGETYRGISRVHHPEWGGWVFLDNIKDKKNGITSLVNEALYESVALFYWANYGQRFRHIVSPLVFIQAFDFSVNGGFSIRTLQECLNNLGAQLTVDGKLGVNTFHAINSRLPEAVASLIIGLREAYNDKIDDFNQEYDKGWENRIAFFKGLINTIQ
jgi:lysozyme family protein